MVFRTIGILLLLLFAIGAQAEEKENDGQDPTRPLTRFDIRALYSDGIAIPGQKDADSTVLLGRIDKPMPLKSGWVFYWRTDVPFVANDVPSRDNLDRDTEVGFGDWFNQFIMIAPGSKSENGLYPLGIQTFAYGFQVKLDSASQDQFGAGRNRFVPLFAWKWGGKKWSLIPIFKYEKSFGSQPDGINKKVENFQFKPLINYTLPNKWFLSFWDSTDWIYENNDGPADGEWSIPIDVMIGKQSNKCWFTEKCVYSFQYIDFAVDDRPVPDWQMQFRVGMFFR